ncbi:hypothetical protein DY000_02054437 [Brassica cretica]|nr:hypothetical protein DY000_02054437 [Brassica cretica]
MRLLAIYASERPYQSETPRSLAIYASERPPRATTRSRSSFRARSPQRYPKVARVYVELRHEQQVESDLLERLPQVTMVKKTKGKLDAENQEAERKESALRGKALASEPAGSGT